MNSTHKIVLTGHDGNGRLKDVVPLRGAPSDDGGKVLPHRLFGNGAEIEAHKLASLFLHLLIDGRRDHVAGLKLVGKPIPVPVQKDGAFAAHRK